jgi:hypothetical protein
VFILILARPERINTDPCLICWSRNYIRETANRWQCGLNSRNVVWNCSGLCLIRDPLSGAYEQSDLLDCNAVNFHRIPPAFRRNISPRLLLLVCSLTYSLITNMEAMRSSETSVDFYRSTRPYNPEASFNIPAYRPVAKRWICKQQPLLGNARYIHVRNSRTTVMQPVSRQRIGKHTSKRIDCWKPCFLFGLCKVVIRKRTGVI